MFNPIDYINEPRWQASRLGLERIAALLERMGRPQDALKFVHVAGTNGKGSTCAYIASILQAAGYRTGLFTSPYIICFEERIRVNGENISFAALTEVTLFVKEHADALYAETGDHPTEFELMTAVALEHFKRSGCDIVVLEVGLGGRLDSTNVIDAPEAAVIARIGLDHTELLGSTLAAVAREKAGIIKRGAPVVSWRQEPEAEEAVRRVAAEQGCALFEPDFSQLKVKAQQNGVREFSYRGYDGLRTSLLGTYQPYNAALAIEAVETLRARGWEIPESAVRDGIAKTVWQGRFEVLPGSANAPTLVIDGGHNPQGAQVLAESLRDVFPGTKPVFIMGVLADKDYPAMVRAVLPLAHAFITVTPPNPRALSAESLAQEIRAAGGTANSAATMTDALAQARALAGANGVVCAFGSLYSIAELKAAL